MWALNGPDDHVLAKARVAKRAAHRAALAAGDHTIAVLANGLDRAYPNAHTDLLNRIGDTGLLLSELPPGTAPTKDGFTARNRLLTPLLAPAT
jgi:DNA processing protein